MNDLDSRLSYEHFDPSKMRDRIRDLPAQCLDGWQKGNSLPIPAPYRDIDRVVIVGMGGSAIAGDLLTGLLGPEQAMPVHVNRDYNPPPFTNSRTLVIASSFSGKTEETVHAFKEALIKKAKTLAITTGGNLGQLAKETRTPTISINVDGEPRSALGFTLFCLIGILEKLNIIPEQSQDIDETIRNLDKMMTLINEHIPSSSNQAKQIALGLEDSMPIVYGAEPLSGVARRWKTQFNENSKIPAFYDLLPELNHNAIVGYSQGMPIKNRVKIIFLDSPHYHPRTRLRAGITQDILQQEGIPWQQVGGQGHSTLSQMMTLVLLGDFASYFHAIKNGIDPSPVKLIDQLKANLSRKPDFP